MSFAATATAYWAPGVSAGFSVSSTLLTFEKNLIEGGGLSMDSKVAILTTSLGLLDKRLGQVTSIIQNHYDLKLINIPEINNNNNNTDNIGNNITSNTDTNIININNSGTYIGNYYIPVINF